MVFKDIDIFDNPFKDKHGKLEFSCLLIQERNLSCLTALYLTALYLISHLKVQDKQNDLSVFPSCLKEDSCLQNLRRDTWIKIIAISRVIPLS